MLTPTRLQGWPGCWIASRTRPVDPSWPEYHMRSAPSSASSTDGPNARRRSSLALGPDDGNMGPRWSHPATVTPLAAWLGGLARSPMSGRRRRKTFRLPGVVGPCHRGRGHPPRGCRSGRSPHPCPSPRFAQEEATGRSSGGRSAEEASLPRAALTLHLRGRNGSCDVGFFLSDLAAEPEDSEWSPSPPPTASRTAA